MKVIALFEQTNWEPSVHEIESDPIPWDIIKEFFRLNDVDIKSQLANNKLIQVEYISTCIVMELRDEGHHRWFLIAFT